MTFSIKNIFLYFASGIIFSEIFIFLDIKFILFICFAILSILFFWFFKRNQKFFLFLFLLIIFFGGFWHNKNNQKNTAILFNPEKTYEFTGKIVVEPEKREFNQRIIFQPDNLKEKILIQTSLSKKFSFGEKISIKGKLKKPENFQNEKGIEFNYVNFLKKENIFYTMPFAEITKNSESQNFLKYLFIFKENFMIAVNQNLPSPQSELVGGILLGLKSSLGEKLEKDFRRAGLIHIVVLSGYNITIIALAILAILFFLPLKFRLTTGILAIILFAILVGGGATVIRASFMAIIAIVAKFFNQNYDVNKALFLAGFLMILINPDILIYDPSFQLSFLATYGLINFGEAIKKILNFLPEKFGFKEIIVATVSTQIAVFPLLSKMIGEISIVSLIVNVIVLPIIPISMLFGFLTGIFGLLAIFFENQIIFSFISKIIGYITNLFLIYVIKVTEFFSSMPFATIDLPKISWIQILFIYGFIIILFNYRPIQIGKKILDILRFSTR